MLLRSYLFDAIFHFRLRTHPHHFFHISIMTDKKLMDTPAGAKVRLDAAKTVLQEPASSQTNIQVNVDGRQVTPGYVIRIDRSNDRRESSRKIDHLGHDEATIPVEEVFDFLPQLMCETSEEF